MIDTNEALPGRSQPVLLAPKNHTVLGTPIAGPVPDGFAEIFFGLGCFWGAERRFWQVPGVYTTAVGYQGGYTPNPTYDEVCTRRRAIARPTTSGRSTAPRCTGPLPSSATSSSAPVRRTRRRSTRWATAPS